MSKQNDLTEKEVAAIDALKQAIKNLPPSLYIETDDSEGVVIFWKRTQKCKGEAKEAVPPMRCKRAVCM